MVELQATFLRRCFVEGDDNQDGVLQLDEFDAIVKKIHPATSPNEMSTMFHEAIMQSHHGEIGWDDNLGDAMTPEAFSNVAISHGLHKQLVMGMDGTLLCAARWRGGGGSGVAPRRRAAKPRSIDDTAIRRAAAWAGA